MASVSNTLGSSVATISMSTTRCAARIAPATLEGEMWTLRKFFEYLEQIDAVEDGLADSVRIPDLDLEDRVDDTTYPYKEAYPQIQYYRNSSDRSCRKHAYLEALWNVGARKGGLRALDVRDFDAEEGFLEFHHRPDTDTLLKNKRKGERVVGLPPEVADVLNEYITKNRYNVHDDNGRQPLFASMKGRPAPGTPRMWSYLATLPCVRGSCPHGKSPETCQWTEYAHASKCPSSAIAPQDTVRLDYLAAELRYSC
ncbi:MAG: site-specific integrase [Natrialbaceae archaeon]|nr:site-specific integrase [Natrialbaceae archaeon]